jgi:hypothetical protein
MKRRNGLHVGEFPEVEMTVHPVMTTTRSNPPVVQNAAIIETDQKQEIIDAVLVLGVQ